MYRLTCHATPTTPTPLLPAAPIVPETWVPCPRSARGHSQAGMPPGRCALCVHPEGCALSAQILVSRPRYLTIRQATKQARDFDLLGHPPSVKFKYSGLPGAAW